MLVSAVVVALVMMFANLLVVREVREEAIRQADLQQENSLKTFWELFDRKGGEFRIENGALWTGAYRVNGNNEIPDKIFDITGSRATVFMGNIRVATNVLLPDGKRALGTTLTGAAYDAVFKKGVPYRGEALILGIPYFTAYDPIRNARSEVIGALFVGVRQDEYLAHLDRITLKIRAINMTLTAVFVMFAFLLILQRKRSQDELQMQLSFLQLLSDTIPSPIFSKDEKGRYSGCNKAFQSYVGHTREELIGKTVHELWPRDLAERYDEMDRELLQGAGTQVYEAQVKFADGTLHDVIFNKAAFRDPKGSSGGLVGVILDITERKAAEEETRNAYQRTADIVEFLPDATFVVDQQKRVIAWNKALEEMTGVPKEEMLGQGDHAYAVPFYGRRKEILIDLLDDAAEAGSRNYLNFRKDGDTLLAEATLAQYRGGEDRIITGAAAPLFDRKGNRIGGIQTMRDITEFRRVAQEKNRLEAQMHHSRMMEAVMVQLSHGLKTPLTPLFALIPMIRNKIGDPQVQRMLDIFQQCANQIQALADKSRELVRLSSEANRPKMLPVTLAQIVEGAIAELAQQLAERGVHCLNGIDAALQVAGDAEQLELLFKNLLNNAARYAAKNGAVSIHAEAGEGEIRVAVRDDGVGLDPEHTSLIFYEFFKADAARHDLNTQGLGLAICQRIVMNHGGKIWAKSPGVGHGTTIFFTLRNGER
jgi:PAS domain S-box-containing protein